MDINQAVSTIEAFVERHAKDTAGWQPVEVKVLPSSDENDTIKIWFNFGPTVSEDDLPALKQQFTDALKNAHPDVAAFAWEIRAQAF
jgi:hypothetical protein